MLNTFIKVFLIGMLTSLFLTGCSQSDGGSTSSTTPTEPTAEMNATQAQNAMALNALFYPILVPLQGCLSSPLECILPGVFDGQATASDVDHMSPGEHNCTFGINENGKYRVSNSGTELKVEFGKKGDGTVGECISVTGTDYLQDALIYACVKTVLGEDSENLTEEPNAGTGIENEYTGTVTCIEKTNVVFDNYIVSSFGQGNPDNTPNRNTYNMTVSMTSGIGIDGTYQNEKWAYGAADDSAPKTNDETWTFTGLNLSAPDTTDGFTILADGGADYVGTVRLGDEVNNGMVLFIAFDNMSYAVTGNTLNSDVTITGGIKASCHPELVTYSTTATMNDLRDILDADGNRMPSKGNMSMSVPGFNAVPALFEGQTTAQVTITTSEVPTVYNGWRAITTTSSCAELQTILDKVITPPSPVVSGDIILENITFATDTALTNNGKSATGKTDRHAVWYHLGRGQGYVEGQTVAETDFVWSATEPASAGVGTAHVNVYLYDEYGDEQNATFPILTSDPDEYADWSALVAAHPSWTIRTDYFESNFNPTTFFQGNFILRLGDSSYTSTDEAFSIDVYDVHKE